MLQRPSVAADRGFTRAHGRERASRGDLHDSADAVWLGGSIGGQKLTDKLNELGSQGWELVDIFDTNMRQGQTRDVVAVMKRRGR